MQKSYTDKRRRPLAFEKDDYVVTHEWGTSLWSEGEVSTKNCHHTAAVHDVFHVSQLKKCLRVSEEAVDTSQIQIEPDLTYEEKPMKVLDQKQRSTRRKAVNFYKVQWSNHSEEEATWETKDKSNQIEKPCLTCYEK
ncbi:hypothetical protein U9M48_013028 [Paspalum notatum var. saurae]|uniref:Chromo domain-containing protein n=1 Tax=Paspalum notatum var. saurae TaxID=547442 RepID=A0AAQ3SZ68_PASNO